MGGDEIVHWDGLIGQANAVLLRTGALVSCELHTDIMIDCFDEDAQRWAYALGTKMIAEGSVDATREEFMEAIKAAIEQSSDECPLCARYRDD